MIPDYELKGELTHVGPYGLHRGVRCTDAKPVLVKVPHHRPARQADLAALEREFTLLKTLPGEITKAIALLRQGGYYALVFEDTTGVLLSKLCDVGPLDLAATLAIAIQITTALAELHRRDLIHGGISPEAILVDPTGWRARLIDFSNTRRASAKMQTLSSPDLPLSPLQYASPEQTGRMNRSVDYRTDFYSLGVMLYQLLTGTCPFRSDDPLALVHAHIAKNPVAPSELNSRIPKALDQVLMKLLGKTAEERYQSTLGLRTDLEHCAKQWAEKGAISPFSLGNQDVSDRFILPQHLYGRERQLDELLETFDKVCEGRSALLLVSGYSGVGKTTLIQELYKPLVRQRGYFINGKFEQLERNIPYQALLQAFRRLVQRWLTEGAERLNTWRVEIETALGGNGSVLAEMLPEIELILGKQLPASALRPNEAQNRLTHVLQRFLAVVATPQHPLVLFLDDLQWVDPASLDLLQPLLRSADPTCLLLIGAYRDNEVSADHPLLKTKAALQKAGTPVHQINLPPLRFEDLLLLVQHALRRKPAEVERLTHLILQKTDGNPFFAIQFLKTLHQERLIRFDYDQAGWIFDIEAVARAGVTDNVVDLMSRRIQKLPAATQRLLTLAACIGSEFGVLALSVVGEQPPETITAKLSDAVEAGLILEQARQRGDRDASCYRFLHDRVQQAAYALIPIGHRQQVHLLIGRQLLATWKPDSAEEQLFAIVDHLNIGRRLIRNAAERLTLVKLNRTAAGKAKASTAYQAALDYLQAGISVSDDAWEPEYDLLFNLHLETAECEYLCGDFEHAEEHFNWLIGKARSQVDKARIYLLMIIQYENMSRYQDAITVGRQGLALFRIALPDTSADKQQALEAELSAIQKLIADRSIETLVDLPVMQDAGIKMVMKLLSNLHTQCYLAGDKRLTLLNCAKMVHLSLRHGNTEESAHGYVLHAMHIGQIRGDYATAYAFGLLALRLNERLNDPALRAKILMNFAWAVSIWRRPFAESFAYDEQAFRLGNENGLFADAGYALFNDSYFSLLASAHLDAVQTVCVANAGFHARVNLGRFAEAPKIIAQWVRALQGLTESPTSLSGPEFEEAEYRQTFAGHRLFEMFYFIAKLALLYTFDRYQEACAVAEEAKRVIDDYTGTIWDELRVFYHALSLAELYPQVSTERRGKLDEDLDTLSARLVWWAQNSPSNFQAQHLIAAAEIARARGQHTEALTLYETAVEAAARQACPRERALAYERYAYFRQARGELELAGLLISKARDAYAGWSAKAKVEALAPKHRELLGLRPDEHRSSERRSAPLDISTVAKAARAISSEIILENLLRRLMEIAIENAGAERGLCLQQRDGQLIVAAGGGSQAGRALGSTPDGIEFRLALSVVNYVRSTGESMVTGNAATDERFIGDPYVAAVMPKSILCVPMIYQGQSEGILYLENNLATDAFPPERVRIMHILSAQAAISLHNATLYKERRRAQAALKESEAKYHDLYENAPDMFISVDAANAKIIRCNRTFAEAIGYTRAEILGRPMFDMYHPGCMAQVRSTFAEFKKTGEIHNAELQLKRKDGGTIDVMLNSSAVRNAKGKILYSRSVWRDITKRKRAEEALKRALAEVEQLKNRLQDESAYLQEEIKLTHNFEEMVGSSRALRAMLREVEVVAHTDATVLILGETGTGKELIARAVHDRSPRRERALVKVNCAAISAGLVESELFGHVKGAFTGALASRTGRFELAKGGTIFLDEIGELPLDTQVKLLRVLQEQEFEPVGSSRTLRVDVRVIAATNRNLETAVQEGRFRADLYYRLNVFPVRLPPLRERREDIPQLAMFFMSRFAKKFGKRVDRISQSAIDTLMSYAWPGNIRDLQNVIERAAILSQGSTLRIDWELPPDGTDPAPDGPRSSFRADRSASEIEGASGEAPVTLEDVERRHIIKILNQTRGVIEGAKGAASILKLRPSTLRARMKKLRISRASHESA